LRGSGLGFQTACSRARVRKGMRRYVFTIVVLTVLVLLVAGCGGGKY
jgi:hypothetical protein